MQQPLVLMGVVLGAAIWWVGFVFVMLNGLDRARRKAQKQARESAEKALAHKRRRSRRRPAAHARAR